MKIKITAFLLLLSTIIPAASLSISQIKISGNLIPGEKWNAISISVEDEISFYLEIRTEQADPTGFQYKAFLNGKITEVFFDSDNNPVVVLNKLKPGVYIFKAVAYNSDGFEIESIPVSFNVLEEAVVDSTPINGIENNSNYYYIGGLIIFHAALLTLIILRRNRKRKIESIKMTEIETRQQSENIDLKSDLKKIKNENEFLQKQIKQLQESISVLQKANEELVTQNDRLEKSKVQLEELQAEKEKLFAITIHDIKNPASAINGYIELLDKYDLNAVEQQDILQSLAASSLQIINLSHKMTKVLTAKRKEDADELEIQSTSLKSVIESVCKRNYAYAKGKNIKLVNNASPHTPNVQVDSMKIDEVVDNLINNAIKYSHSNSTVKVVSYFSEKKVTVEVIDEGQGMTKYDIANAFNKGKTLSAKPTGGESATGMGLWIVKQIIELHGGEVWIKSSPGNGATIGFDLPR